MGQMKFEIGQVHRGEKFLVSLDLCLQDLYWLQSLVPRSDGFYAELQEGIDWIERNQKLFEEKEKRAHGLSVK